MNDPFGPHGFIETEVNGVTIRLTKTVDGGYTRRVWTGTVHYDGLAAAHTDLTLAARECTAIRNRLLAGERALHIEDDYLARQAGVLAQTEQVVNAAQPATLDTFRQAHRPVRNTRTQAFRKPPTAPMLRLMRQHQGGIVTTDGRANWLTLRAIVDKGMGDVHEVHGRHIIASVRLNAAGYAALETAGVAA